MAVSDLPTQGTVVLTRARLEASLTAYLSALEWLQRYPAADVERRLTAKIAEVERALNGLEDQAFTLGLQRLRASDVRRRVAELLAAEREP